MVLVYQEVIITGLLFYWLLCLCNACMLHFLQKDDEIKLQEAVKVLLWHCQFYELALTVVKEHVV